ncbi:hypothetical protein [Methanobrevibacter sp.]
MSNHILFGLGAVVLAYGCIKQEFEKSGWNVVAQIVGFIGMIIAYII